MRALVRTSSCMTNQTGIGGSKSITDLSQYHGGGIARGDGARFVVDQITSNAWLRKSPLITW